jgi:hypothetical protein
LQRTKAVGWIADPCLSACCCLCLLPAACPQRLDGELLLFMDICGKLLGEMRA